MWRGRASQPDSADRLLVLTYDHCAVGLKCAIRRRGSNLLHQWAATSALFYKADGVSTPVVTSPYRNDELVSE